MKTQTTNHSIVLHLLILLPLLLGMELAVVQPCAADPFQWEETGSMVQARAGHTATLMTNGEVLVIGGYFGSRLASAERYNPVTGTWSRIASLPKGIAEHTATLLPNGKVLVAGGVSGTTYATAELFDPATGKWTYTGSLVERRDSHTATLLANGEVLVTGGYNDESGILARAE